MTARWLFRTSWGSKRSKKTIEMNQDVYVPRIVVGCLVDAGIGRDYQEDCIGIASLYEHPDCLPTARHKGNLYVLADGAGGHEAGDVASEMAVLGTLDAFYRHSSPEIERAIVEAIRKADHRIGHYAANASISARSTLVCAVVHGNDLYTANVGDSRAYLIRNGQATQLSEDHTLVARWTRQGHITAEQARGHSYRHVVTQALGGTEDVRPSVHWEEILPGDAIVLCSDGLHGVVDEGTIAQVVSRVADPQAACRQLVDQANDAGGPDNISVVVIHIEHIGLQESGQSADETMVCPVPTFARQENGVVALSLNLQDSSMKRQAGPRQSLLNRLSSFLERG